MNKRNRDECNEGLAVTLAEIVFMICDNTEVKPKLVVDELSKLPSYDGGHRHKSPKTKLLAKDVAEFLSKMQTHLGISDATLAKALAADSITPSSSTSQESTAIPEMASLDPELAASQYPLRAEDFEEDEEDRSVSGSPPPQQP